MSIWEAGAQIIGGLINRDSVNKTNDQNYRMAQEEAAKQREFAQSGISWKVEDAKRAGIHPLYALGANTVNYAPATVGAVADTSLGNAVAGAGQSLSRAIESTSTTQQRAAQSASLAGLQLERASLENDYLRAQIAKTRGQIGPPMPALNDKDAIPGQPATRSVELPWLGKVSTPAGESQQDNISKEYGDEGLPQIPGQYRFLRDAWRAFVDKVNKEFPHGSMPWDHWYARTFGRPK